MKINDCFIQCYLESYKLYKIKSFEGDKFTIIDEIFVSPYRYDYGEHTRLSEYDVDFRVMEKFPVEIFDKMKQEIINSRDKIKEIESEIVIGLNNYVKY